MMNERELIDEFHRLFYSKGQFQMRIGEGDDSVVVQMDAHYRGIPVQKNPLDLWVYQEILWETRPDLVVEMGTAAGGTTLFIADQLRLLDCGGFIVSVDIEDRRGQLPREDGILYLVGNTLSHSIWSEITRCMYRRRSVMVILDDDHSTDHVARELELYAPCVSKDCYLIVEDTNVDSPLNFGEGPGKAVKEFLVKHKEFEVDRGREKFLMTWNPGGYLKRR